MKILGIDSSSISGCAGVQIDGKIVADGFVNNGLTHSQTLLPLINEVLNKAMSSTGFSSDDSEKIYFYLWIFVHGVATMIATNTVKFTDEQIDDILTTSYLAMKDRINKENKED